MVQKLSEMAYSRLPGRPTDGQISDFGVWRSTWRSTDHKPRLCTRSTL